MRRVVLYAFLAALLTPGLLAVDPGPATAQADADDGPWTDISVVYTGDVGGKIEPCG